MVIRRCHWTPGCGKPVQPYLLHARNDSQHDFGYPCSMPRELTIDGLVIDDSHHPQGYQGPYLFTDPDGKEPPTAPRPYPNRLTEQVTIRGLTTASGLKPRISAAPPFAARVKIVEAN